MSDLEGRLRGGLAAEAGGLPAHRARPDAAIGRGNRRRRRRVGLTALCWLALGAGTTALTLRSISDSDQRVEAAEVGVYGAILFHADHEGCEDAVDPRTNPDWVEGQADPDDHNDDGTPTFGFAYNSGRFGPDLTWGFEPQLFARGERAGESCVLATRLERSDEEELAIRLFRRYDRFGQPLAEEAYYSAWLYLPNEVTFDDSRATADGTEYGFWSVLLFMNRNTDTEPLTAFSFNVGPGAQSGTMGLEVFSKVACGEVEACPEQASIPAKGTRIPVREWVHIEIFLRSRVDGSGRLQVWQDGEPIVDYEGQTQRAGTGQRTFAVTNSGQFHHRSPTELYVDDVTISADPQHPRLFD